MKFMADVHLVCEECKGNSLNKYSILNKQKHLSNIRSFVQVYYFSKKMKKKYQKNTTITRCWFRLYKVRSIFFHFKWWRTENKPAFLGKGKNSEKIIFIFDEPTTAFHFHDIKNYYIRLMNL